jgi:hypothetical protein
LRIHLSMVTARIAYTHTVGDLMEWSEMNKPANQRSHKHDVTFDLETAANKIEQSRSLMIESARKFGADIAIQFDNDVTCESQFRDVISFLNQDFGRGADMVISPTTAIDFQIMAWNHNDPSILPVVNGAWPITYGALGMYAISGKTLEAMKPVGEFHWIDKAGSQPLYLTNPADSDDSASLCVEMRKQGFKLWADSRILNRHWKLAGVPSYRSRLICPMCRTEQETGVRERK